MSNVFLRVQTGTGTAEADFLVGGTKSYRYSSGGVGGAPNDPDTTKGWWSQLREFTHVADQEIAGTPSTGGPQAVGRVDLPDIRITKNIDPMTPKLFEYCCKGLAINRMDIHIVANTTNSDLLYALVFTGCFLTLQKTVANRYLKNNWTLTNANTQGFPSSGNLEAAYGGHAPVEEFTVNYTTVEHICVRQYYGDQWTDATSFTNIAAGWHIGENAFYAAPSP